MRLKLSFVLITSLFANSVYTQAITYKDLIGIWNKIESRRGKFSFQFVDSVQLSITNSTGTVAPAYYHLDTTGKQVSMTIECEVDGIKVSDVYIIKLISPFSLRMESANPVDPVAQTRPFRSYLYLRKRKATPQIIL